MTTLKTDKRRDPRTKSEPTEVALIVLTPEEISERSLEAFYVELINRSQGGALIKTDKEIRPLTPISFQAYDARSRAWVVFPGLVRWIARDPRNIHSFLVGIEFREIDHEERELRVEDLPQKRLPFPSDYEFFQKSPLLRHMGSEAMCAFLNNITHKQVHAAERFITQGEEGNTLYFIQSGSCKIIVEKGGELIPISTCHQGDVLGEMALLTGEPRSAHVEAETDMSLWGLTRAHFEQISQRFPDLRVLLTEIVSERFSTTKEIAERKIGKYIVTDIIGQGSYSVVYKGKHAGLDMPVCVKMLKHNLAMDPGFQRAFRQEARIIAGFNHPNIVRVHDIEERYRTLFIIMEYLEGVSLRYLLDHGPSLSYQRILSILIQACAGLDYAHKKGVVHRDIKPANLFLLSGDQVKILDFGVAAPTGAEAGNVAGTIHYLAPEQIACDPVDERIDIYALGISAYEMVTGQRPYCADDPESLITMHLGEDIPDPATSRPDIPEELRAFIITACRRDPDERYRDFGEAVQELQSLADKFGMKVENGFPQKKKMTTINLVYDDSAQDSVNRLLEEFSAKAEKLGIMLKTSNLRDLPK